MVSAIIVAGGSGSRMGGSVPKQFIGIGGTPILMRTMACFDGLVDEIIIVLPEFWIEQWSTLCSKHNITIYHKLVAGGAERCDSVRNGLAALDPQSSIVMIHDGVRPFASASLIGRMIDAARQYGAAVPALPLTDTIRSVNGHTLDRSTLRAVQTPQSFQTNVIRQAYNNISPNSNPTDDASVVELSGTAIHLIDGERENIKITTPLDIKIAEILW